jgi:sigma-B regulation protein RsbU (phosphoserine phosphatase)
MSQTLRLRFTAGGREPVQLSAGQVVVMGRAAGSGLQLEAPQVSGRHASLQRLADRWMVTDLGSRNGTFLNGTLIPPQQPMEVGHGDTIAIHPFQMRVEVDGMLTTMGADISADEGSASVRGIDESEMSTLAGRRLQLLLDAAGRLQAAEDLPQLANGAAEALLEGTGFGRAAVLRGQGTGGVEVLAERLRREDFEAPRFSRSLIRAAGEGRAVRLEDGALNMAESIVGAGVTAAVCMPILVGSGVEGFVYLDSVGGAKPGEDAAAFAQALARLVGLGWSEVHRRDLAERRRTLEEELSGAHAVQRRLMPSERDEVEGWRWRLHSEPGKLVAGDIVGAGSGPAGAWLFLGDVAGKGAAAGMLMASIQAHMASDLERGAGVVEAVERANRYVIRHRAGMEFATLMAVRLAADGSFIDVVDAGHGLGFVLHDGVVRRLECDGGPPLGVAEMPYGHTRVPLPPGARVMLFSDGVNEQRNAAGDELGVDRAAEAVATTRDVESDVETLLAALRAHAAGLPMADDVSLVSVCFEGTGDQTRG